jgi:hypothetical protein
MSRPILSGKGAQVTRCPRVVAKNIQCVRHSWVVPDKSQDINEYCDGIASWIPSRNSGIAAPHEVRNNILEHFVCGDIGGRQAYAANCAVTRSLRRRNSDWEHIATTITTPSAGVGLEVIAV